MEGLQFIGGKGAGLGSDLNTRQSLFPQESRTFRSNQMECFL
ncbi:UNVERIFIED_ORG: hypothetical protein QFZ59_001381 [Bacillus sp. B2I3]|nr:hypothetical protein [Bacillus sp. B2I3]